MLALESLIQLFTIIFALAGAYFVANTTYNTKKRKKKKLFRARAFLNESFLNDNRKLLFLACLIFLINATLELNSMLGLSIKDSNLDLIQEMILLGVLVCTVVSEYKWFKLMNPVEHLALTAEQESFSAKESPGKVLEFLKNDHPAKK